MSQDFVRNVKTDATIFSATSDHLDSKDREQCIRIYRMLSGPNSVWRLQVRGPRKTQFAIASASLSRSDMKAILDAINTFLTEVEE